MCGITLNNINTVYMIHVSSLTGTEMLQAREGIQYGRGEDQSIDALRAKFSDYCPVQNFPYEQNPFFTCVERAGLYADVSSVF